MSSVNYCSKRQATRCLDSLELIGSPFVDHDTYFLHVLHCSMQGYEVSYTIHESTGHSSILVDTNMYEKEMGEAVSAHNYVEV